LAFSVEPKRRPFDEIIRYPQMASPFDPGGGLIQVRASAAVSRRGAGRLSHRNLGHAAGSRRRTDGPWRQPAAGRAPGELRPRDRGTAPGPDLRIQQPGCLVRPRRPGGHGLVGWDAGKFHWSLGASLSIPAGGYEEGELSNLAFNRWIGDVFAAGTWFDPETGLDISGAVGIEFNGENPDTDYRSGNAFHVDLAVTKNLTKEFSVGVLAGYYDQISSDSGEGNRIGPFKGRVTAVGASATYNVIIAGTPVTTRLKVLREVDVENRPQGTIGLFTLAFPLGSHAAPESARPVTAKY
jgi:hypothetical protein